MGGGSHLFRLVFGCWLVRIDVEGYLCYILSSLLQKERGERCANGGLKSLINHRRG